MSLHVAVVDAENTPCLPMLPTLLEDSTTHDVTFKTVDGGSLGAHRAIVAANSPVFHAMLYGRGKESKESEIYLSSINTNMLKMIFTFLYTGMVQVNTDECLGLLQAAHYFNISTLEAKCGEMFANTLNIDCNLSSIITFAIEHQLDLLLKQCLELMEINAEKVIHTLEFNTLPLCMMLDFLKSSNLEVREIDLFLAVAKWIEHNESELSTDNKNQVLQLIRYPLIGLNDLLMGVRPSKLADQNFYTAALEYNNLPISEICESEFSQDQLSLRRYFFDFASAPGLLIEHKAKGTIITLTKESDEELCTMAKICPTVDTPVRFKLYANQSAGKKIMLGGYYKTNLKSVDPVNLYNCGNKEGSIRLRNNYLVTEITNGTNGTMQVAVQNEGTCVMCIFISGIANTKVRIQRL